jgi:hyperosmotically inducible protein
VCVVEQTRHLRGFILEPTLKQEYGIRGLRMTHWKPALALLAALMLGAPLAGCGGTGGLLAASPVVEDSTITTGVKTAIGGSTELHAADIDVATREGIVQLSGYVVSAESVATAASVARTVKGVKSVRNDLRLK